MTMRAQNKTKTVWVLLGLLSLMIGLVVASVPLYKLFCEVTGYGGTTARGSEVAQGDILERRIKVRFSASTHRDMPWEFKPVQDQATIRVGERALAFYEASNPTDKAISGQATFNVTPFKAGPYFVKIDCFCFTEQTLAPGARADMPVSYYIDPAIADNPELNDVTEITLHYTFFRLDPSGKPVTVATIKE